MNRGQHVLPGAELLPSMPLPPELPPDEGGCDHGLRYCACAFNTPPPPSYIPALQQHDAARKAQADACISYAHDVLQIPLTSWQEAIVTALYMGEHVRVGRAWGLHTVERVITQHEASRGDTT